MICGPSGLFTGEPADVRAGPGARLVTEAKHLSSDRLPGVLWHLSDAWRRCSQRNFVLVHYDDLSTDLE